MKFSISIKKTSVELHGFNWILNAGLNLVLITYFSSVHFGCAVKFAAYFRGGVNK